MRRVGAGAAAIALLVLMAGCTSASEAVSDARAQALAATRAVELALDTEGLPTRAAETVVLDALDELDEAVTSLIDLRPDAVEAPGRDDALTAVRDAQDAVLAAQRGLADAGDLDGARDLLDEAGRGLE